MRKRFCDRSLLYEIFEGQVKRMQNRKILKRLAAVLALLLVCAFAFALAQEQEEYRTLEIGCRGEDVTRLKKAMYWLGYFTSDKVSDEYNDVTARRVILFQQNNGLEETGIATPEMQQLLYSGTAIGTDTAPTPSPVPTPAPTPVCPAVTPGDLPQLDESGFLPADSPTEEYVYANEEDGQWIYISKDLSITIRRYWDKLNKNMWFEGDIRCSPEEPLKTYVEHVLSSLARHQCAFNSCHFLFPPNFSLCRLLLNQASVNRSEALAEDRALTQTSLALGGLNSQVVTVVVVRHLYLSAAGKRKSLGRCFMRLNLSHVFTPFLRGASPLFIIAIRKGSL